MIATSFSSLNTNNTNNILVNIDNSENCKTPYTNEWDYSFQNTWDCYCNIGLFQSPISLTLTPTPNSFPGFLSFKYIKSLINPVAIPKNSREIEIFGNFGDLIYHNPEKDTLILSSYKLAFKFPSEHKVNGKQFPLEIEIYHKNRVQEAVLSIFVLADKKGDSEINKFIEDIDSPTWNFDEKITIFSKPDLRNLGPENGDYMGSFFMYTGSDTSPPCRENIIRFDLHTFFVIFLKKLFLFL